jgi:hypothetical protein
MQNKTAKCTTQTNTTDGTSKKQPKRKTKYSEGKENK